jgi:hypothetical protein
MILTLLPILGLSDAAKLAHIDLIRLFVKISQLIFVMLGVAAL